MMLAIAAATEDELKPSKDRLGTRVSYLVTGVGSVLAAATTSKFLTENHSNGIRVIFVGSYGSYTDSIPILSSVSCRSVHFGDSAAASGLAHIPELQETKSDANPGLVAELEALVDFTVSAISPGSILDDVSSAKALANSRSAQVENLELFGVATACGLFGVPWGAAGVVTNYLGPESGAQWKENAPRAALMTVSILESIS